MDLVDLVAPVENRGRDQSRRCFLSKSRVSVCFIVVQFLLYVCFAKASFAQTIDVNNSVDFNAAIQTINANPATNYTLNFLNGFTMGQQVPDFAGSSNITLAGNSKAIDGAGIYQPLTIDSGTVTLQSLSVTNTSLPTTIHGGTLIDQTGSLQGNVDNNGVVQFNQTDTSTYAGNMSGTGSVQVTGMGTVTFSGLNSYTGGTTVDGGTTLIGTTDSLQGAITNKWIVNFNQSNNGVYAGDMSGVGALVISGGGQVTLSGNNDYQGGTLIDTGSKLIGTTGSLQGLMFNNGTLQLNQSTSGAINGGITGVGNVQVSGGGTVTLLGTNSYTGGTVVDSGSKVIGTTLTIAGGYTNNGVVQFNQNGSGGYLGNLTGTGSVEISGSGPVSFFGTNSYSGGTTIDGGSTLIGSTTSLQGAFHNDGLLKLTQLSTATFASDVSGVGQLEIGGGTITLTGNNTHTGGTVVDSGTLVIGTTANLQGNIVNNGSIRLNPGFVWVSGGALQPLIVGYTPPSSINNFSGNMSGTGRLEVSAGAVMTFSGINSYTGGTTVDVNGFVVGNTNNLQGDFVNNGVVEFSQQGMNGTFAGNISGTGSVGVAGPNITFSGTNTYSGGTTVASLTRLIGTTSSLQGHFLNDGIVQFNQGTSGTFAGSIDGAGQVEVSGAGPVKFTGINNYQGGTTIDNVSTLIGTTASLQGLLTNNGTVRFDQTSSGTFAGSISGHGRVEIDGVGPVIFSGNNGYTGVTSINTGATLDVTGTTAGPFEINNGGILTGTGTVGSTVVNAGGTIHPGTIGSPLTINGDFTQGNGSTYSAEISSIGGDRLIVNGTATILDGTRLNLAVDSGPLIVGTKYDLLTAANGLIGQYSSVTVSSLSQNIEFAQEYSASDLQLIVNSSIASLAQSSNQRALATIIDQSSGSATGDYADAITQLTLFDAGQLSSALNQLSGDIYASLGTVERQTTTIEMQLLSNRLASLTSPGIPPVGVAQRNRNLRLVSSRNSGVQNQNPISESFNSKSMNWTGWAQGYGLGGNVVGDGNAAGTNYRLGGTLFGVERWLAENTLVGVLGGYSNTSVGSRQDGANAQITGFQAGLYELHRRGSLYLSNIDAFGNNQYDVTRPISFGTLQQPATSNSSGNRWSHYTEAGVTFHFDETRLQPFTGLQYMYLDQNGFSESGAGGLNLIGDHQTINSVRNSIGARFYQEATWGGKLVIPTLAASYQREWGDGTQLVTSSLAGVPTAQFVTAGNRTGRDFGLFSLGGTAFLTERLNVYGMVDAQVAVNYFAVIGSGGLQLSW